MNAAELVFFHADRIPTSGLAWSLYTCADFWRAVYGPAATKRPIETIREEKGISSRLRVSISSRYDLRC